jgi:hypothetical protein
MLFLVAALFIIVGAFAVAVINEFVDSLPLAVALQVLLLVVMICVFVWLR